MINVVYDLMEKAQRPDFTMVCCWSHLSEKAAEPLIHSLLESKFITKDEADLYWITDDGWDAMSEYNIEHNPIYKTLPEAIKAAEDFYKRRAAKLNIIGTKT